IFKAVIKTLEERIAGVKAQASQKQNGAKVVTNGDNDGMTVSILNRVDLSPALEKADYLKKVKKYQERIRDLEHEVYVKRIPVVIVYEGWDAAGKGGNIKRLTQHMDPRGYEVIPIAAPNDIEKRHHYLWRFWQEMPKAGHIAIFDRSWYGRVLVERVEGFCTPEEYKRAYREINEMEEHLANYGTVLVKFWLQIDKEEQLRRFTERKNSPFKSWKLTDEDWRNREKWDIYQDAVEEMLFRTSSPHARWTIVESNSKYYARLKALKTVIGAIEAKL
ncbi:MAG: phosphate--AMP phosphotransferase, partial [Calditrichaeota bacterium]|nr:phosphate--AMP phosphotransferase [Calditrichota bacterium]